MATPAPPPVPVAPPGPEPRCSGTCHLLFQYEIGQAIHLDRCQDKVATRPVRIRPAHRSPSWFEFDPPPLIVEHDAPAVDLGRYRTDPAVTLVLYDFGAVSVSYTLPFSGTLEELVELSAALGDLDPMWVKSRQLIERLLQTIGSAVERPRIGEPVEEYLVFQIQELTPPPPPGSSLEEVANAHASTLARILRSERGPLSAQEVQDATSSRVAYAPDDLLLVDWQAAILFGGGGEDVRSVLEFASVQLLDLRQLDLHLDRALDRAYELLSARRWLRFGSTARAVTAMGQLQVDAAILFERVNNALKLLGDQYLARVYQQAAQRFRLAQWNAAILRKLDTLESIYQKMSDRAAARRMEALEWIIIVLIAVSMVLPYLHG